MRSFYAIYRKELGNYFVSPIAYVVVGAFLAVTGYLFARYLADVINYSMQMAMQSMRFGGPPQDFDAPSELLKAFFGLQPILILILMPMITMGVYAEERKRGTMELLMTSPITETDIVLGKFFATLSLFVLMLLPTLVFMIFTYLHSDPAPPWRVLIAGYSGALLFGGALIALGTFISSLTENQIVAAVLTFAIFFILWILDIGSSGSGAVASVVSYLSVIRHFEDFPRGIVDTSALVYYGSFIFLFVFLTVRSIDSMRWRRA